MDEGGVTALIAALVIAGFVGALVEDCHTRDADEEVGAKGQECYANNTCDGTLVCFRIDVDETRCEKEIEPVTPKPTAYDAYTGAPWYYYFGASRERRAFNTKIECEAARQRTEEARQEFIPGCFAGGPLAPAR